MRQYGKDAIYLGEWRYHPFPGPSPTQSELYTVRQLLTEGEFFVEYPLLLTWGNDFLSELSAQLNDVLYNGLQMEEV